MSENMTYSIPETYNYINLYNSGLSPSTVHVKNVGLQRFFRRYLLQRAMAVFKWQMPETWNVDFFLYTLYVYGFVGIIETDKFGVIPQNCTLYGYNVFYQPTNIIVSNPLLRGIIKPKIGEDCVLVKLQPDYGGVMDLVNYYADMMALCAETASVNLLNSHLSYIFPAKDKASAETYKKMFDKVASGEPAVVLDKSLFKEDGTQSWEPFTQNIGQNYIVDKIFTDLRSLENMFDTAVGIPNANTQKKERLITDEVNSNNVETTLTAAKWLEQLKQSCKEANQMFGISLSVDWRVKPGDNNREGGADNGENS